MLFLVQTKVVGEKCQSVQAGLTHGQCHLNCDRVFFTHVYPILALLLSYFSEEEYVNMYTSTRCLLSRSVILLLLVVLKLIFHV